MNRRPRRQFDVSVDVVRNLLGSLQKLYSHAVEIRSEQTSLRELVAATSVCHELEEGIAKCREHLSAVRLETGWNRFTCGMPDSPVRRSQRQPDADHPAPESVVASALTAALIDADRRAAGRRPPREEGDALGVVGAQPPPVMGHGWPASAGAGSALGFSRCAVDAAHRPGDPCTPSR